MSSTRSISGAWLRKRIEKRWNVGVKPLTDATLQHSAMIFAPHYDDETLGCGGLIIEKRRCGANVQIVFMTDGSASHGDLMSKDDLANLREAEAYEAGRIMGVARKNILPLYFPDGQLEHHQHEAVSRIIEFLEHYRPEQVWLPHSNEPLIWSPDHWATTKIVKLAMQRVGSEFEVFEYPIWLWFSYPWVDVPISARSETLALLRNSAASLLGWQLVRSCRWSLDITKVAQTKRAALAAYRTQMGAEPSWPSLENVAQGQFLTCFFQHREVFAGGGVQPLANNQGV